MVVRVERGHFEKVGGAREWEACLTEPRDEEIEEAGSTILRENPLPTTQDRGDEDGPGRTEIVRRHMARSQDEER